MPGRGFNIRKDVANGAPTPAAGRALPDTGKSTIASARTGEPTAGLRGANNRRLGSMPATLSHHEALIYVMVTISAVDRAMSDEELSRIGHIVSNLPVFHDYDENGLVQTAQVCGQILAGDDGLSKALALVKRSLPVQLRETAYALAVEVAAADLQIQREERRFLELLAENLEISKLVVAAIERGARARHRTLT
jgi:tellurite resistance protein